MCSFGSMCESIGDLKATDSLFRWFNFGVCTVNNAKKFARLKARLQKKFLKGTVHRALVIRTSSPFVRTKGIRIKFDENAVVLVTIGVVPVTIEFMGLCYVNFVNVGPL